MKIKVVRIRSLLEYAIIFLYVISSTMAVWRYVPGNSKTVNMITYMVYLLDAYMHCKYSNKWRNQKKRYYFSCISSSL